MILASGAELRLTSPGAARTVICVNGGQANEVPGTWSATLEYLVRSLSPRFPALTFAEVRYRIKSWQVLDLCIEDCRAAIDTTEGQVRLVGFSMGGAVAISAADHPRVEGVIGLAPWIPDRLSVAPIAGKRLDVIHGSLDRWLPGIPGVSASLSRRGFERALQAGGEGTYTLIRGGVHGLAVRGPGNRLFPLPRASAWTRLVERQLDDFAG